MSYNLYYVHSVHWGSTGVGKGVLLDAWNTTRRGLRVGWGCGRGCNHLLFTLPRPRPAPLLSFLHSFIPSFFFLKSFFYFFLSFFFFLPFFYLYCSSLPSLVSYLMKRGGGDAPCVLKLRLCLHLTGMQNIRTMIINLKSINSTHRVVHLEGKLAPRLRWRTGGRHNDLDVVLL